MSWKAMRPEPGPAEALFEPPARPKPAAPAPRPEAAPDRDAEAETAAAAALDDDLEFVPSEDAGPRASAARARARARKAPPEAKTRSPALGLGIAAGLVLAAIGGVGVFRDQIVQLAPVSAPAFTAVGLPVNETGLVIEQVKSEAAFQGGRPVLSVTGAIRNLRQETAHAPAIRVSLTDKEGRPLAAKLVRPLNGEIPGGAKRYFAVSMADPPSGSHDLEVVFEKAVAHSTGPAEAHGGAHAPAAAPAHAPAAEAHATPLPEPVEAKPLPPGSPDALPEHHG